MPLASPPGAGAGARHRVGDLAVPDRPEPLSPDEGRSAREPIHRPQVLRGSLGNSDRVHLHRRRDPRRIRRARPHLRHRRRRHELAMKTLARIVLLACGMVLTWTCAAFGLAVCHTACVVYDRVMLDPPFVRSAWPD